MTLFDNPYIHGNWAGIKMMKKSTGDAKRAPSGPVLHRTNTPSLDQQVEMVREHNGGMATPSDGPKTN